METSAPHDTKEFKKRFLKIFTSDPDTDVKRICIWLLEDCNLDGVKEEMMDYALILEPRGMSGVATEGSLLESLNKRLGVSFWHLKDMREYIKELRRSK